MVLTRMGFHVCPGGAYPFLETTDTAFLKTCTLHTHTAPGPGGQKKNRTYSAVRLVHRDTGAVASAAESRSQTINKNRAVRRLRKQLALTVRQPAEPGHRRHAGWLASLLGHPRWPVFSEKHPEYPRLCAVLLDCLYHSSGAVKGAAELLRISTGRYAKLLSRDPQVLAAANDLRRHFDLKPLRH